MVDVSIALVTRNGMATLPAVLDAIDRQAFPGEVEVVAVDSESDDGSRELLDARADRVESVRPADFNHGLTRNRAIELAAGELVVLLVQDAVPADERWLAGLVAPFAEPTVAGAYARQLPHPEASRLTRWNLGRWIAAAPEARSRRIDDREAWEAKPPVERFLHCVFDNVCSCVRRSVWRRHPFPAVDIGEDLAWSRAVLLDGHRIDYAPAAAVHHSHERGWRYELDRTYLVHRQLGELFGVRTIPDRRALLRSWTVTLREHLRVLRTEPGPRPGPREIARALALALAWPYGQYLGGRAAADGRDRRSVGRV